MAETLLYVHHGARRVGRLSPEPLTFIYEPAWLEAADAFQLSVALPLRAAPFEGAPVRAFFFNLLPEGNVRRRLAGRLKLSEGNDYALLAAVGGECAGALTILPSALEVEPRGEYAPLPESEIGALVASGGALSAVGGRPEVRLSLAGAQDKLPVYIDEAGEIFLPKGSAASSHILKFEARDFKQLAVNEAFVLRLAAAVGLSSVKCTVRRFGRLNALVVERYDRVREQDTIRRLHQEDLCQALDVPAERKYEAEGGPSFARCVELIRSCSVSPAEDVHAAIRWQLLNVAVGNADGHAKNLALLHGPQGTRLAPLYDLVCTRAYPHLSRSLAMQIGGSFDPDRQSKRTWARFAADLGVGERYLRDTAEELAEATLAALEPTLRALEREVGRKDFLRSAVVPVIRKSARGLARSLHR